MSRAADGKVRFAEWLPDLAAYDSPGLTEAKNVIPAEAVYKPYLPISGVGTALAARPQGATSALDSSGNAFFYAGTATKLYVRSGSSFTDKSGAVTFTTASAGFWRFGQFDTTLIATNYADVPQRITVGSGGNFANLAVTGTAPRARHIGIVNRFVVLGDTSEAVNGAVPNKLQWSAIDDETNWPTPGSATALSLQSGEQFLNGDYGPVRSIVGGDQYGIILQRSGVTRQTYVGGNVVFQFDTIEKNRGAFYPNATVSVGRLTFFRSSDGFFVTDGVQVLPIGLNKVDNHFADTIDTNYPERMYGAAVVAVDPRTQLFLAPLLAFYVARGVRLLGYVADARLTAAGARRGFVRRLLAATLVLLLLGTHAQRLYSSLAFGSAHHIVGAENRRVAAALALHQRDAQPPPPQCDPALQPDGGGLGPRPGAAPGTYAA